MFANTFQSGFLSIFYSIGSNPLNLWDKSVKNGHIRRIIDDEVKSLVLEVSGTNVATTYITCPIKPRASLGIRLPFLVMVVKNLKKYFTFEIQILDDKNMRRRFRVSNFQTTTKVRPFCTTMPIGLSAGWNQIQFNLADFTRRAYGTLYMETIRVQIHANVRIRRIYFSNRLYTEEELPSEYKLFVPVTAPGKKSQAAIPIRKSTEKAPESKGAAGKVKEEEIPSGAPPTPVEVTEEEVAEITIEEQDRTSAVPAFGDVVEVMELAEKVEEDAVEGGEVTEAPPAEGEAPAEGGEEPNTEPATEEPPTNTEPEVDAPPPTENY